MQKTLDCERQDTKQRQQVHHGVVACLFELMGSESGSWVQGGCIPM
jgi:hypothetical protein